MTIPAWGGRRAQQARALIATTLPRPCSKCGQPVQPWQQWDVDHVLDRDTHPGLTWVPSNWAAAHARCNRSIGAARGNKTRNVPRKLRCRVTVLWGPPCSGKSTYIAQRAEPDDVVIDFDRIAMALGHEQRAHHDYSPAVRKIAHEARFAALRALSHPSVAGAAWVIDSGASPERLQSWSNAGATVVRLDDVDMATCLRRAEAERPPEVQDVVRQWFAKHAPSMMVDSGATTTRPVWTAPSW